MSPAASPPVGSGCRAACSGACAATSRLSPCRGTVPSFRTPSSARPSLGRSPAQVRSPHRHARDRADGAGLVGQEHAGVCSFVFRRGFFWRTLLPPLAYDPSSKQRVLPEEQERPRDRVDLVDAQLHPAAIGELGGNRLARDWAPFLHAALRVLAALAHRYPFPAPAHVPLEREARVLDVDAERIRDGDHVGVERSALDGREDRPVFLDTRVVAFAALSQSDELGSVAPELVRLGERGSDAPGSRSPRYRSAAWYA